MVSEDLVFGCALGDYEEPAIGAHIVSPRMCYRHHGIYLGNHQVVHYGGARGSLPGGRVEVTLLESFARSKPIIIRGSRSPLFTPQQVIVRALSRLGEDRYDWLTNNCEHFCEWCLHDRHHSRQVENLLSWGAPIAPLLRKLMGHRSMCQPLRQRSGGTIEIAARCRSAG
jgi:hypothetical protein